MSSQVSWQYKVIELKPSMFSVIRPEDMEEALNKHGALGWELVHTHQPAINAAWLYLKKPK